MKVFLLYSGVSNEANLQDVDDKIPAQDEKQTQSSVPKTFVANETNDGRMVCSLLVLMDIYLFNVHVPSMLKLKLPYNPDLI